MPFPNYQGGGAPSRATGWGFPGWLNSFVNLFRPAARPAYTPTAGGYGPTYRPPATPTPGTPPVVYRGGFAPGPRTFGSTFPASQQVNPMGGWAPGARTFGATFPATQQVSPLAGWAPGPRTFASTFNRTPAYPTAAPNFAQFGSGYSPAAYQQSLRALSPVPQAVPTPPPENHANAGQMPIVPPPWLSGAPWPGAQFPLQTTPFPGYSGTPPAQGTGGLGGYGYGGYGGYGRGGRSTYNAPPQYAGQPEQALNNMQVRTPQQQGGRFVQQQYAPRWLQTLVNWQV